jgi:hypothetical protein
MAGNLIADQNGDILVEFDYNNIIVVDPNKTIDAFGKIQDRLVDHDKLVMFANLEAEVLPRTKLAVGASPNDRIRIISVAKMNFLKPTKESYLGTGYYDELTGENSTKYKGQNQLLQQGVQPKNGDKPYTKIEPLDLNNIVDNGLLGITQINITTSTSFIPSVKIELEDVQGRALFQLGDNSPYSAFFNLPYPQFYLTLKGYYGQAIRYQLNLQTFNARFNTFSGNYQVSLEFKGYKFNIINEISMGHLLALPHMYGTRFDVTTSPIQSQQSQNSGVSNSNNNNNIKQNNGLVNSDSQGVTQIVAKKGYQKIKEVYSEYKSKGLIPLDFPELTLVQLMNKLQSFEQNVTNAFPKAEVEPLTNIRTYKEFLKQYFDLIRGSNNSWFNKYLDPRPIILGNDKRVYVFKSNLDLSTKQDKALPDLKNLVTQFTEKLAGNNTLGVKGPSPIVNPIRFETIVFENILKEQVNWVKTTTEQTGILDPTTAQTESIKSQYSNLTTSIVEITPQNQIKPLLPEFFIFEGEGRFDKQIASIEAQANKKLSDYEASISNKLLEKIQDVATGIGFKPTVRNIIAVIMASTEGFIRLMDEVHTNAWNVKYDPIRKRAILDNPSSAPNSDDKQNIKFSPNILTNPNFLNSLKPVYPWPQFFVETPEDKKGRFQLKYIADPTVVNLTQGYLYAKWPEVEFVEEYIIGLTQKFDPPAEPPPLDNESYTNRLNINAIEFPNEGVAYVNKEEVKFFYEIWERQFLTSRYSNLIRANQNQIDDLIKLNVETEVNNIVNGLGLSSPFLTLKLKEFNLNSNDYPNFLQTISNSGTGRAYQDYIRDFFVTPYIRNLTENSFGLLNASDLGKIPQTSTKSDALLSLLNNASNDTLIIDTLPFTNPNWTKSNLTQGQNNTGTSVFDTKKTLKIFEPRKIISNFNDVFDFITNRPVTNFSYKINNNPILITNDLNNNQIGLSDFYLTREPSKFVPTEGYCYYNSPSQTLPFRTTTSILNTPYFINSILNGVYNNRSNDPYPYVQAAYLFLNSLPIATLREKYKKLNGTATEDLDYIASCFKKFGAIHKLPYTWILKLGSNWHRYKKYKQTSVDILKSCWNNFDYLSNYSPILSSLTQTYTFKYPNVGTQNITLQQENSDNITMNVGFYPKLITDFNYFYTGYDLYSGYTNEEIQKSVDQGMKIHNYKTSNFGVLQGTKTLNFTTWSVLVPELSIEPEKGCDTKDNTRGLSYFVIPSFGSGINQTKQECVVASQTVVPITSNSSVFNGSVRGLWSSPNYGYFDNSQIRYPNPDEYVTYIESSNLPQSPFSLLNSNDYTKIEEIFSVFEKRILDTFEDEFLKFCKPMANADTGPQPSQFLQSNVNIDANFRNFQSLFKSLMTVPSQTSGDNDQNYFQNVINEQYGVFKNGIQGFMEYDIIFKYGNPSNYKRRIWDSYLSYLSIETVTDPITFNPYIPNSLPSVNSRTTLNQSKINNQQSWITLELEVGFSTIPNVAYTNNGSYFTDFFIQNNIEFTSQNIILLAPLIKMWATQKLINPNLTVSQFKSQIKDYLKIETDLQNNFLDQVLTGVRKVLPNQQQLPERVIKSAIDGEQSKVMMYEVFKALNDKWIAGGDFSNKTLFEDMLFLDRASRNIGETIIIDIFDLKNMFSESSINQAMSVFTFISGILIKNNFTVMNLPAYVNFYNVQDVDGTTIPQPEGSLEFANSMWGTFLDVDYRKSSPKMICFFVGKPSQYLDLPSGNFRFRNDGFDMGRASENPLIENQKDKKDWSISNKCVGFNVDIGTRNQNIFYSFSVSQDNGVATSESINTMLNMVDQASGRNVATQNVSLYNFYTQRSYKCDVVALGNALIQPTMYFNLRHVPMFNGPYMITNVAHTIQPGNFQTQFSGVRQGVFDLPAIDTFLQSINQNLLTKLEELLKIEKDKTSISATTENNKAAEVSQKADNKIDASNSCVSNVDVQVYRDYTVTTAITTELTPEQLVKEINTLTGSIDLKQYIYYLCYIKSFVENNSSGVGKFVGYNNNFANISLYNNFTPTSNTYFTKNYCCINVKATSSVTKSEPFVSFKDVKTFLEFIKSRLEPNTQRITSTLGFPKYYVCYWPKENVSESAFDANINQYSTLYKTYQQAVLSAKRAGLISQEQSEKKINEIKEEIKPPASKTDEVKPNLGQTCPPPVISSFAPTQGNFGTIIQINGSGFENVTGVTINGVRVDTKNINVFNPSTMRVTVPQVTTTNQITTGSIILQSPYGNSVQLNQQQFIYNPSLLPENAASPGSYQNGANASISTSNTNTNPQNTGPITMISSYSPSQVNPDSLNVKINPQINGWLIDFNVKMNFTIKEIEQVNGQVTTKLIKQDTVSISNLVTNNQFNITKNYIISNNLLSYTPIVGKSQIEIVFILKAISTQQKPTEQQFSFNIYYTTPNQTQVPTQNVPVGQTKITYPEKPFAIVGLGYQDTLFGNGPTFYNIVKPGGGFIGMEFTPPAGEQINQSWIVSVKVINKNYSVLKISTENSQNTKLTNVINVSGLGEFRLQIEYKPYGDQTPVNGDILTQTLLGPIFTL